MSQRCMFIGVRSYPIMHTDIVQTLTHGLPSCDLDYERNHGFFHYFLKIRGIVKKLAIFYTIFLANHPV